MEIFVISKIWQFFSKILEKLVKSTLESMIFKKFPNSFYQKKTTFVCVCVCVTLIAVMLLDLVQAILPSQTNVKVV